MTLTIFFSHGQNLDIPSFALLDPCESVASWVHPFAQYSLKLMNDLGFTQLMCFETSGRHILLGVAFAGPVA